jgi:hypothetical protein
MKRSISFNIIQYYLFFAVVLTVIIAFTNPTIAEESVLFLGINFLLFFIFKKEIFFKIPVFFFTATFFGGFIFRTYSITNNVLSYRYYRHYPLEDLGIIETALQDSLFGFILILLGYCSVTLIRERRSRVIDTRYSSTFLKNTKLILFVVLILTLVKLFLHLGLGIGQKGIKSTQFTGFLFIIRLIPRELPFIILTIYFLKYRQFLSYGRIVHLCILAFLVVLSVLATGSKTFILNFGLAVVVYAIYYSKRINLQSFVVFTLIAGALITFSFVFSDIIRYQVFRHNASTSEMFELTWFALQNIDLHEILGAVSSRFSGLDGQILLEQDSVQELNVDWDKLYPVYDPLNILYKIIDDIIPFTFVRLSNLPSSGQAVGMYVFHYSSDDAAFAGSLGLFGSVEMISKSNPYIYSGLLIAAGILVGLYFRAVRLIADPELKFILYFFGCFLILHTTISGNFDLLFSQFIIKIVLLLFYGFIVLILRNILKKNHTI